MNITVLSIRPTTSVVGIKFIGQGSDSQVWSRDLRKSLLKGSIMSKNDLNNNSKMFLLFTHSLMSEQCCFAKSI